MAAVSNKKGVVGSKGRNMPIMPSMSEVVPTMVYSIFIGANIDQKTKKYSVLFILFFFMVYLCVLQHRGDIRCEFFLIIIKCYVYSN